MRIRILFLIDRLALGGTEKQLMELIRHLNRNRFEPYICTLYPDNYLNADAAAVPLYSLYFKSFHDIGVIRAVQRLSQLIRRHRIQIVQAYFQDPTLIAALSYPWHDALLIGSFRDLGFWRNRKETYKMRLAYKAYNGFIANSKAVKNHFVKIDQIHPAKIKVIYNGIDGTQFRKTEEDAEKAGNLLVGIVANLNRPVKRVQDFVKASAIVHRAVPEARFVIIGDGQLRPQLEDLGVSLGVDGVLDFMGHVQDPVKIIKRFTVGVITSETEGFCNAIIEYMASGVPVVASATGGNWELVTEPENGFLYPVGDIDSLAQRIIMLLDHKDICDKVGKSNRALACQKYSMQKMVLYHELFYYQLVHHGKKITALTVK